MNRQLDFVYIRLHYTIILDANVDIIHILFNFLNIFPANFAINIIDAHLKTANIPLGSLPNFINFDFTFVDIEDMLLNIFNILS